MTAARAVFERRWSMTGDHTIQLVDAAKARAIDEGLVVAGVRLVADEYVAGEWRTFVTLTVWRKED